MQAKLYIKPNVIGLFFANAPDREAFWAMLGSDQASAEKFGDRSIRFIPAKAPRGFSLRTTVDVATKEIIVPIAKPAPQRSTPVPVTIPNGIQASDIRPPAPIPPVAVLPLDALEGKETQQVQAALPIQTPQPTIVIPQIASVVNPTKTATPDPEPADKRTKAWKEWNSRQHAKA